MIEQVSSQSIAFSMALYRERTGDSNTREEPRQALPVGLLLSGATSVDTLSVEWPLGFLFATNAGLSDSLFKFKLPSVQNALREIKSNSGLTWQQLSRVFNVSRRSLYLWMDGETLDSGHQERLYRLVALIRRLPFSEAFQNRAFLLSPQANGRTPIDLLAAGDDDAFLDCVSATPLRRGANPPAVSERVPLPPSILMDAKQDKLHIDMPGRRAVKAVKRRGTEG